MLKCDNKSGGIYMKNIDFSLKYLPMCFLYIFLQIRIINHYRQSLHDAIAMKCHQYIIDLYLNAMETKEDELRLLQCVEFLKMKSKITFKNIILALLFSTITFQAYIIQMNEIELTNQQTLAEKMMDMIADDMASFHNHLTAWQV